MDMLKELMKKKAKGAAMDPKAKDAKMSVLKDIRNMAANDMGDEVKGLKKVSVMAPDTHSLTEGLDKAKELVGDEAEGSEHAESPAEEAAEPGVSGEQVIEDAIEHEGDEGDLSPAEIDDLIAELQEQKAKKLAHKQG